jgi:hypothetical protein
LIALIVDARRAIDRPADPSEIGQAFFYRKTSFSFFEFCPTAAV